MAELKKIIAAYLENGVPADLVEAAKRHEIADAEFQKNSISGLADVWSQALAVEGRQSPGTTIEAIRKVTVDDVDRVARQYLDQRHGHHGRADPPPFGKAGADQELRRQGILRARTRPSRCPCPRGPKKPWPSPGPLPSSPQPSPWRPSQRPAADRSPQTISPTVSVYGRSRTTPIWRRPRARKGVDQVLDDLFSYGTTTLDRLAFQKALDEIAADESAGTNFSLQVLSSHFDRGMELLADNLLHPALPETSLPGGPPGDRRRPGRPLQSPAYLAHRALRKGLFPKNDPALRQATPKTVSALTLEDVRAYYRKVFRPDLTTIVIVGHVTTRSRPRQLVEKYFGDWKAVRPATEDRPAAGAAQ